MQHRPQVCRRTYDDQGRLTQLANIHPTPGNLATYAYGYDHNWVTDTDTMLGQRTSLAATVPSQGFAGSMSKYYYDGLYQLNRVDYPNVAPLNGEVHSWTYDDIGNRLTNTVNATTQTYSYQQVTAGKNWQRLLSDGVNSYTYDFNGNTQARNGPAGNFTFGWDYENRMSPISGAITASYKYDYQGRRSSKTVGTATSYLYDGLNLIQEGGASSADYLFGPGIDEPLAMSRGAQIYYPAVDALGSVAALSDSAGTVQNNYIYDAWGQARTQTGTVQNPFGYTAREFGEAGTLFYRARYLSPAIGRFLSEDPFVSWLQRQSAAADAANVYTYADNDPAYRRDPLGLKACGPAPKPTDKCAADCVAGLRHLDCLVHNTNDAANAIEIATLTGGGWKCLPEHVVEALPIKAFELLNDFILSQAGRNCLNYCEEKRCQRVPIAGSANTPAPCNRPRPWFRPPILPY